MEDFINTAPTNTYELSPLDIIPSHLYITNAFFFENPNHSDYASPFMGDDVLRTSFYRALRLFPILAGHLRRGNQNTMHIAVDRADLNMPVYEERLHRTVHFSKLRESRFHRDSWPNGIHINDPRIVSDDNGRPKLVTVQIHRLAKDSGVVIVVRIAHCAVDAKGFVDFVNCWAQLALTADEETRDAPIKPLIDRREMYRYLPADAQPAHRSVCNPRVWLPLLLSLLLALLLRLYEKLDFRGNATLDDIEDHLFRVPRSVLDYLRDTASQLEPNSSRISDNDIIIALFTLAFAHSTGQIRVEEATARTNTIQWLKHRLARPRKVQSIVPCDFRHRIGLPQHYTGCAAIGLYVSMPQSILRSPITTEYIARAALVSRGAVDRADRRTVERFISRALRVINLVGSKANVLYSMMVCQAFSNQSRLRFYDADFGGGCPALVVPMAYPNTVAVIMAPDATPNDGVHVFLTLRRRLMQTLLKKQLLGDFAALVY